MIALIPLQHAGNTLSFQEGAAPVIWESEDGMAFSIRDGGRTQRGTTVVLHIMEEEKEFLDAFRVREVLERYAERVAIISGGSDYHADFKKGVKKEKARNIGECGITLEYFEHNGLLQAILGKNRPSLSV